MAEQTRHVVAFVKDLFFSTKIMNAIRHLQQNGEAIQVSFAKNGSDLVSRVANEHPTLVIFDLSLPNIDLPAVVREVRGAAGDAPLTVMAFGPHTDKEGRAAARAAGCDLVVANSRFDRELPQLLQRFSTPEHSSTESLMLDDDEEHAHHG